MIGRRRSWEGWRRCCHCTVRWLRRGWRRALAHLLGVVGLFLRVHSAALLQISSMFLFFVAVLFLFSFNGYLFYLLELGWHIAFCGIFFMIFEIVFVDDRVCWFWRIYWNSNLISLKRTYVKFGGLSDSSGTCICCLDIDHGNLMKRDSVHNWYMCDKVLVDHSLRASSVLFPFSVSGMWGVCAVEEGFSIISLIWLIKILWFRQLCNWFYHHVP